ncbi:MAG: agmatine deiminase family protein [Bacteroidales bacterium]|nr:agmatine deiminase family protein [Bacteroidales bacterium]
MGPFSTDEKVVSLNRPGIPGQLYGIMFITGKNKAFTRRSVPIFSCPSCWLSVLGILLVVSCHQASDRSLFYHPADFEPARSTCFIWSEAYYDIIPRLTAIISEKDSVTLFLDASVTDTLSILRKLEHYGTSLHHIRFMRIPMKLDNIWLRDFGPLWLVNLNGDKKLGQFKYFWNDNKFMEAFGALSGLPVVKSEYNSTGGSREVNGKGVMILCETHELDVNKPRTREEIETEMIDKLNLEKVIWLKQGIPQDDSFLKGPLYDRIYPKGVNGHVDEFCRFADARTILISSVTEREAMLSPILLEAKKRMDENYEILANATDQDGKPFRVIKVPYAPLLLADRRDGPVGEIVTLVTSYMNFIITNSYVILPSYASDDSADQELLQKEREVEQLFRGVFPSREIIRVRADTLNYHSGGFHCISMNEPQI